MPWGGNTSKLLNQPAGENLSEQEILELHDIAAKVEWLRPALDSSREAVEATLAAMKEEKRLQAEEGNEKRLKQPK